MRKNTYTIEVSAHNYQDNTYIIKTSNLNPFTHRICCVSHVFLLLKQMATGPACPSQPQKSVILINWFWALRAYMVSNSSPLASYFCSLVGRLWQLFLCCPVRLFLASCFRTCKMFSVLQIVWSLETNFWLCVLYFVFAASFFWFLFSLIEMSP